MGEKGQSLAITAETLVLLYLLKHKDADSLALNHLSQTVGVSVIGGVLLVLIIALILLLGGFDSGYTWMVVILYFTFIHSSLIFMGVFGLVRALNGQHFVYPWIGRPFKP
jgi:uncharacterized Tic20 family protein